MTPARQATSKQSASDIRYIALGDSLTHGMQSLGVAWISQHESYPKLIADFLGVPTFKQPVLHGGEPNTGLVVDPKRWVGSPPNLELVARAAQMLGDVHPKHVQRVQQGVVAALRDEGGDIAATLRQVVSDYLHTLDENPDALLAERPAPDDYYQNLGVYGFLIEDIQNTKYMGLPPGPSDLRQRAADVARHALGWLADRWDHLAHTQPGLPLALTLAALAFAEGDLGGRLDDEKLRYVLGTRGQTAFDCMRAQQPRLVTLLIGNNNMLSPMFRARLFAEDDTPLYTPPEKFEQQLSQLVDAILQVESNPYLFVATLPSPTASPNLVRDRLGHWKSIVPSPAYLVDDEILLLEEVIAAYNDAITRIAAARSGRVWLVDIFALHSRILRATRQDAEAVRVGVEHAVRTNALTQKQAAAVVRAARAGNLDTIAHLRDITSTLRHRSFYDVETLPASASGADLALPQYTQLPNPHIPPTAEQLNAFVVRLKPAQANGTHLDYRYYRLTGEYLSAGDDKVIAQGGAVGLDTVHLTNTGYAYVAREFLKQIYEADQQTGGKVLHGLPGSGRDVAEFDDEVRRVAEEDTLLNDVPTLVPAVLDFLSAASGALGGVHYADPVLAAVR